MKNFLDTKPLYCDFERNDYCSIKMNSKPCTSEKFQIISAASTGDDSFTDVSLGVSKYCLNGFSSYKN